jgi:hypothetical protein
MIEIYHLGSLECGVWSAKFGGMKNGRLQRQASGEARQR